MPILDPRSTSYKPADWRQVWDAYQSLIKKAKVLGIPTLGWKLIYPTRVKSFADPRWQMQFNNLNGVLTTVYLGSSGNVAAKEIQRIDKIFGDRVGAQAYVKKVIVPKRADPRFSVHTIKEFQRQFDETVKAKSLKERNDLRLKYRDLETFLRSRAGILPMSMHTWLYRDPRSVKEIVPPRNQQELDDMTKRIQARKEYEERRAKELRLEEETIVDTGPGWQQ